MRVKIVSDQLRAETKIIEQTMFKVPRMRSYTFHISHVA